MDVYDIAAVLGQEFERVIDKFGCECLVGVVPRVVQVLEFLEVLVGRGTAGQETEELRGELDRLRRERSDRYEQEKKHQKVQSVYAESEDETDSSEQEADKPRFTLQELRDVLHERNELKAQVFMLQEELAYYKRSPAVMEIGEESSPALAFEKDAFELTVEDVYDISYVIGRDLLKISSTGEEVSDLQFRIVRVLEMFETLVNKYNLSVEELKMERDNLKAELDRIIKEGSSSSGQSAVSFILRFKLLFGDM
ncbi:hypothetical protein XENOCAPTIV_011355 [Xenoophorus captivus]|uniref:RILP-like protein 1 n=1 Tax=Xenoophorus captivus TaxID=1517983 RepID=A0ABV0R147_9TELE